MHGVGGGGSLTRHELCSFFRVRSYLGEGGVGNLTWQARYCLFVKWKGCGFWAFWFFLAKSKLYIKKRVLKSILNNLVNGLHLSQLYYHKILKSK